MRHGGYTAHGARGAAPQLCTGGGLRRQARRDDAGRVGGRALPAAQHLGVHAPARQRFCDGRTRNAAADHDGAAAWAERRAAWVAHARPGGVGCSRHCRLGLQGGAHHVALPPKARSLGHAPALGGEGASHSAGGGEGGQPHATFPAAAHGRHPRQHLLPPRAGVARGGETVQKNGVKARWRRVELRQRVLRLAVQQREKDLAALEGDAVDSPSRGRQPRAELVEERLELGEARKSRPDLGAGQGSRLHRDVLHWCNWAGSCGSRLPPRVPHRQKVQAGAEADLQDRVPPLTPVTRRQARAQLGAGNKDMLHFFESVAGRKVDVLVRVGTQHSGLVELHVRRPHRARTRLTRV